MATPIREHVRSVGSEATIRQLVDAHIEMLATKQQLVLDDVESLAPG